MKVVQTRGPVAIVAVKFKGVKEPPSYDTGNGHLVACYLYRPSGD